MKKILLLVLLAPLCLGIQAATKKKNKKNKKAQSEVVVDTVDVKTFSYLIGRLNTQGLAEYLVQQKGIDAKYMEDFIQGFSQTQLTEADLRAKARIAGTEIREDISKRVMPNISKQMNDSTDILNHEEFVRGFLAGLTGAKDSISNDSAMIIVEKQMKYYQEQIWCQQKSW